MVEHYYRNVHAVVFVYDVTKMASFRNLQTWIEVGIWSETTVSHTENKEMCSFLSRSLHNNDVSLRHLAIKLCHICFRHADLE